MTEKSSISAPPEKDQFFGLYQTLKTFEQAIEFQPKDSSEWWQGWGGEEFLYNPLEDEVLEVFTLHANGNNVDIYNLSGTPLDDAQKDSVQQTFEWFHDLSGGRVTEHVRGLLIGNFLGTTTHAGEETTRQIGGLWLPNKKIICLNADMLSENLLRRTNRYWPVAKQGASELEIILTHELAHAFGDIEPNAVIDLADSTNWEVHDYELPDNKVHSVIGIGHNAKSHPVTDYGYINAVEDFAESMVHHRFMPPEDFLHRNRRQIFAKLMSDIQVGDSTDPSVLNFTELIPPSYFLHAPAIANQDFAQNRASEIEGYKRPGSIGRAMRVARQLLIALMGESYFGTGDTQKTTAKRK